MEPSARTLREGAGIDQQVKVGDLLLRVRRIHAASKSGSPVLVFLHDSLGCVETWRDFPGRLAKRAGLDALIYDRRGYGQSSPFGKEARTTKYLHEEAEVLFALLDALGIQRVALFGHSDGGSIALLAAALRPGQVDAVVTEGAHVFVEEAGLSGILEARAMLASTDLRERLVRYHGAKTDGRDVGVDRYVAIAGIPRLEHRIVSPASGLSCAGDPGRRGRVRHSGPGAGDRPRSGCASALAHGAEGRPYAASGCGQRCSWRVCNVSGFLLSALHNGLDFFCAQHQDGAIWSVS